MEIKDQRIMAVFVEEVEGAFKFVDSNNKKEIVVPTASCLGASILLAPFKYTLRKLPNYQYVVEGLCN